LLKNNINLESIGKMSEDELMQYVEIIRAFDEIEQERMDSHK